VWRGPKGLLGRFVLAREIARLKALDIKRATRPGLYHDGGGLYLQVSRNGSKSWTFRYGAQGRRYVGLGATHTVALTEARERARRCRQLLLDGIDPIDDKRTRQAAARLEAARAITFNDAARQYIASHKRGWKNPKSESQWTSTLAMYADPVIGKLPVASIDTGLVLRCVEPIWADKTETATRVRARIEAILDWAQVHGYRTGDNPARWRGCLEHLLPAKSKVTPVEHYRAVPYAELADFIIELHQRDGVTAEALEFLILTAARSAEVLGAEWSEFDLPGRVWVIPASRMKGGKEHRVPLSDRAVAIVKAQPRNDERVFPLTQSAMLQLLRWRMNRTETPHGFRSSFRDWAAETTDYPNHVVEKALAHTVSDKVEAAYRRGDLFDKRRALMNDWAAFCASANRREARHG
jgi:integrase